MSEVSPGRCGLILSGEVPPPAVAARFVEVSLIRGEYVLRRSGHYVTMEPGRRALVEYLTEVCRAFTPKPVWYRLSDFESREISTLHGADAALDEENPILGPRGTRRALLFPDAFVREAACVAEVMAVHPNLRFLPSYVGTAEEFLALSRILERANLPAPRACMIETPSAVREAEQIRRFGARRLVIGLNDLTSLVLGVHRGAAQHRRDHPIIDEIVAGVARGGETVVANCVDPAHGASVLTAGTALVAVHYTDLPAWFGYRDLPDLDIVQQIKQRTAALLVGANRKG